MAITEAERAVLSAFPANRVVHPESVEGAADGPVFQAHLSLGRKGLLGYAIPVIPNGGNFGFYLTEAGRSSAKGN